MDPFSGFALTHSPGRIEVGRGLRTTLWANNEETVRNYETMKNYELGNYEDRRPSWTRDAKNEKDGVNMGNRITNVEKNASPRAVLVS